MEGSVNVELVMRMEGSAEEYMVGTFAVPVTGGAVMHTDDGVVIDSAELDWSAGAAGLLGLAESLAESMMEPTEEEEEEKDS